MPARRVSVLVVPDEGGQIRQFRLRVWPAHAMVAAAVLMGALVLGSGVAYLHSLRAGSQSAALYRENEALRSDLVSLGDRIDGLDASVRANIQLANEARLLAGLPPYGEEVALLGVGGMPSGGAGVGQGLPPGVARTVEYYEDRLDQLTRQLAFQAESFVEVRDLIEENRTRLDHIPTINPVLGKHYFSSGFGPRRDPFTGQRSYHNGLDISAERGTPFCATAAGRVICARSQGRLGNTVKVDHGNGFVTVYGHAKSLCVRAGETVRRGEVLGEVGDSGRTTGVHLHYEVRKNERPVNPWGYILDRDR